MDAFCNACKIRCHAPVLRNRVTSHKKKNTLKNHNTTNITALLPQSLYRMKTRQLAKTDRTIKSTRYSIKKITNLKKTSF